MGDPASTSEVVLVEEEKEEPARSGVPVIEGTRIESSVVEEGVAIQVVEVEGA